MAWRCLTAGNWWPRWPTAQHAEAHVSDLCGCMPATACNAAASGIVTCGYPRYWMTMGLSVWYCLWSLLQESLCLSLDERDFDTQYVLEDPAVLGEERRQRREQHKRDEERNRRRAVRQQTQARSAATTAAAAPAPAPAPAAVRVGRPGAAKASAQGSGAAAEKQRRSSSSLPPAAAAAAAVAAPFAEQQEQHGESNTPPAKSHGRQLGRSLAADAGAAEQQQEGPSPGDSSGSR